MEEEDEHEKGKVEEHKSEGREMHVKEEKIGQGGGDDKSLGERGNTRRKRREGGRKKKMRKK